MSSVRLYYIELDVWVNTGFLACIQLTSKYIFICKSAKIENWTELQ